MLTHPRLSREGKTMANWFCPACGEADNRFGLYRSLPAIGSPRATFHHGPERERSTKRPEIRLQSNLSYYRLTPRSLAGRSPDTPG
jgi:hypothetical protein